MHQKTAGGRATRTIGESLQGRYCVSPQPKRHFDRFSCLCRAYYCDRQTDRQSDHATRSV